MRTSLWKNLLVHCSRCRLWPMAKPTRMASTTAVMPDALMMELTPMAMEQNPNKVGRLSFSPCGKIFPSAVPSRPPSSTAVQFVKTPIGILSNRKIPNAIESAFIIDTEDAHQHMARTIGRWASYSL